MFFSRGSRSRKTFLVAVTLVSLLATFISMPETGSARHRYRVRSTELAEGLTFTRIFDHKGPKPKRIKILEVDPATSLSLDVTLAGGRIPGLQKTSEIASEAGALAAVNGTYFLPTGRPIGVFSEDADFKTTPLVPGNAFSTTVDQQQTYIGKPNTSVDVYRPSTGETHRVHDWNEGVPARGQIGGFSFAGGSAAKPPRRACSARLQRSSDVMWSSSGVGYERDYVVEKTKCDSSRLRRGGGTVLATPRGTKKADILADFYVNETVRLSWSVGWPQVIDAMAGNPVLVENGVNVGYKCESSFCKKQPRTGIGVTSDNRLLLVTVDGRRKKHSVGMNLFQFGRLFESLGAVYALNLDGGGSTTMVVDGEVKNRPSDSSGERAVGSAVLVLPGSDPDQPKPRPYSSPTTAPPPPPLPSPSPSLSSPSPSPSDVISGVAPRADVVDGYAIAGLTVTGILTDPGSTGGLLDAINAGDVGRPSDIPPSLRWALRVFGTR